MGVSCEGPGSPKSLTHSFFKEIHKSALPALVFMVRDLQGLGATSPSRHTSTRGVRAFRKVAELSGDCRSSLQGGAAPPPPPEHQEPGRQAQRSPSRCAGNCPVPLARAGAGQAARWLEEDKRGQENRGGGCFPPPPQHLEASQRQQETLSSPRGPHPVSKNADFCAQSEVELVGMCVHPQHGAGEGGGRARPVDTGRRARLTAVMMTTAVAMVIVTIYRILTQSYTRPSAL